MWLIGTAPLTQSGLLTALLQHQGRKLIESAGRRTQRLKLRGVFRSSLLITAILSANTVCSEQQRSLGTFIIGTPNTMHCLSGSGCRNFTVRIPDYRYNATGEIAVQSPPGQVKAVDLFFQGSAGTTWWGGNSQSPIMSSFFAALKAQGHEIVQVRWKGAGWLQSMKGIKLGQIALACRPATVIAWVKNNYPAQQFNVIGSSAGGAALAYSLANYPIPLINKAVVIAGPPFMKIAAGCKNVTGYAYPPYAKDFIDFAFSFNQQNPGPCWLGNRAWENIWNANSVESGQNYLYQGTAVHIIIGSQDNAFIRNRGNDYFTLLSDAGKQPLRFHLINGMGHILQENQDGLNTLLGVLIQ